MVVNLNPRSVFAAFLAFAAFAAFPQEVFSSKLNKEKLLDHVRESYDIPGAVEMKLGDLKKSEVPGFDVANLSLGSGKAVQNEKLYVSKDGKYYQLGAFNDLSVHPDDERLKMVDITDSAVRGDRKAPVTVIEYTDFECYYCNKGYEVMMSVMQDFKGKVRWIYKSLPLNSIHPWAQPAAVAVECAGLQSEGMLWSMHDKFFDNQRQVKRSNVDQKAREYAQLAGANLKRYDACYENQATLGKVRRDLGEAAALGITGTPAFMVNGHMVKGADGAKLRRIIREALKGRHGGQAK